MERISFVAGLIAAFWGGMVMSGDLSGSATYRERIAMPPAAVFEAVLSDPSSGAELGRMTFPGDNGPPYAFSIAYENGFAELDRQYALRVSVSLPEGPIFAAETMVVLPASEAVALVMKQTDAKARAETLPAHGLALPASFAGRFESNGLSTDWTLSLWPDQAFQLSRVFRSVDGSETRRDSLGRWSMDPARNAMMLRDGAEMPLFLAVLGPDRLGQLALDGGPIERGAGELVGGPLVPADLAGMFLGGTMTYTADVALIEECLSGQIFPIAAEGDFLALEGAYLADRSQPGGSLHVLIEGGVAMRPATEGPNRQTVVVDRFIRTTQGETCERQLSEASLTGTYWRIDMLMDQPLTVPVGRREPHLLLRTGDTAGLSATVGCNMMRASYQADDGALSFGSVAATMMACPEPLGAAERALSAALAATTGYAIEGGTLVLKDDTGAPVAVLTAVYF